MRPDDLQLLLNQAGRGVEDLKVLSTGSLALDLQLGIRGWPAGKCSEIYGEPAVGKSTLLLHSVVAAQPGSAIWFDLNNSFDPERAAVIGVNLDHLIVVGPPGDTDWEWMLKGLAADLIVFDGITDQWQARQIDEHLGDMSGTVLCATQTRANVSGGHSHRVSSGRTGGWISGASCRVLLKQVGGVTGVNLKIHAEVLYNAFSRPSGLKPAKFTIDCHTGIDHAAELLDLGLAWGLITREAGNRYYVAGILMGHGRAAALECLGRSAWSEVILEKLLA